MTQPKQTVAALTLHPSGDPERRDGGAEEGEDGVEQGGGLLRAVARHGRDERRPVPEHTQHQSRNVGQTLDPASHLISLESRAEGAERQAHSQRKTVPMSEKMSEIELESESPASSCNSDAFSETDSAANRESITILPLREARMEGKLLPEVVNEV